ncbi:MAG: SDR family NAD(P)-dependent oxidoreductase, partial [Magnetococcales bacterium]|nr:SDR family NAD(P)-dependent oxidoreductase [Magnetococcales bacterium]
RDSISILYMDGKELKSAPEPLCGEERNLQSAPEPPHMDDRDLQCAPEPLNDSGEAVRCAPRMHGGGHADCGGVALVTGGGRRLGAVLCRELSRIGFAVAVVYHQSEPAARRLAKSLRDQGGRAEALSMDLTNPARIATLVHEVERSLGPLRLLVNNAGVFAPTQSEAGTWEAMDAVFKGNLQGPLWLSLKAAERMRRHGGGSIINLADVWGERPLAGHAAYCAAKAGVIMMTQVLARDLAPDKIRVNAIAPGGVLPPDSPDDAAPFQVMLQHTPLASHAHPEAILRAVRYLLDAPFVTGEILHVDGGRRLV